MKKFKGRGKKPDFIAEDTDPRKLGAQVLPDAVSTSLLRSSLLLFIFFKIVSWVYPIIQNKATYWNQLHWQGINNPEIVFSSPTVPNNRVCLNTLADPEVHPDG